jgi:hypothetical protein
LLTHLCIGLLSLQLSRRAGCENLERRADESDFLDRLTEDHEQVAQCLARRIVESSPHVSLCAQESQHRSVGIFLDDLFGDDARIGGQQVFARRAFDRVRKVLHHLAVDYGRDCAAHERIADQQLGDETTRRLQCLRHFACELLEEFRAGNRGYRGRDLIHRRLQAPRLRLSAKAHDAKRHIVGHFAQQLELLFARLRELGVIEYE